MATTNMGTTEGQGATTPAPGAPASKNRTLQVSLVPGKSDDRVMVDVVTDGLASNAETTIRFEDTDHLDNLSITEMVVSLRELGEAVNRGDLSAAERMLSAQAVALNTIFAAMASRAQQNMGKHLGATETYMRLALKAQSQSRATVETLAAIKNPPTVFAQQANINNGGQQQVNVGGAVPMPGQDVHAREKEIEPSKLLETPNGERMDFGTTGKASRADPGMATLGAIKRPQERGR